MHFTNHGVVVRFDFILELGRLSVAAILAKSILRAFTDVIAALLSIAPKNTLSFE